MDKFKEQIDIMRTYWSPDDEVQNDLTDLLVFFSKIKTIKKIKQFMLETFGGDDGTGNLNKIYEYLDDLEKTND